MNQLIQLMLGSNILCSFPSLYSLFLPPAEAQSCSHWLMLLQHLRRKRARRGRWSDEWCWLGRPATSSSSWWLTNDSLPSSCKPRPPGSEGGEWSSERERSGESDMLNYTFLIPNAHFKLACSSARLKCTFWVSFNFRWSWTVFHAALWINRPFTVRFEGCSS